MTALECQHQLQDSRKLMAELQKVKQELRSIKAQCNSAKKACKVEACEKPKKAKKKQKEEAVEIEYSPSDAPL